MSKFLPLVAVVFVAAYGASALADEKPSGAEAKAVEAAIAKWNCTGGTVEKESEASGVFEVDDATCAGGQYDVKLDKTYTVIAISRD